MSDYSANINLINDTASKVFNYEKQFVSVFNDLTKQVNHLGELWNSETYNNYLNLYKTKYDHVLIPGQEVIHEFYCVLIQAGKTINENSNNIINMLR